jgi:hypothetical protein
MLIGSLSHTPHAARSASRWRFVPRYHSGSERLAIPRGNAQAYRREDGIEGKRPSGRRRAGRERALALPMDAHTGAGGATQQAMEARREGRRVRARRAMVAQSQSLCHAVSHSGSARFARRLGAPQAPRSFSMPPARCACQLAPHANWRVNPQLKACGPRSLPSQARRRLRSSAREARLRGDPRGRP